MELSHSFESLPREPGWYWFRRRFSEEFILCEVFRVGSEMMVRSNDGPEVRPTWLMSGSWVGPLYLEGKRVVLF